jgi:uncharacterized protein (TIGR04255 family)
MPARPADLPDFRAPPVTEVVLGVQFNSLPGFMTPHLGLVWEHFKARFPNIEEHPPLDPVFETFGIGMATDQYPRLELLTSLPPPRVFFINEARTQLLQVQRDRFLHNWRKVGEGEEYPRFEKMIETFKAGFADFEHLLAELGVGSVVPNQCEVTYVNQMELGESQSAFSAFRQMFGAEWDGLKISPLGEPDDCNVQFRYLIKRDEQTIGRLTVQAVPGRRSDGKNILQLTLTGRGTPDPANAQGVYDFMVLGRDRIVKAFTQLTTKDMHTAWGRTQ